MTPNKHLRDPRRRRGEITPPDHRQDDTADNPPIGD
jgi:hypothetical protein